MYKKLLAVAIGLCAMMTPTALAADHMDGPAVKADPPADITDLFTWMSPDATQLNLVMDVLPNAGPASGNPQFSNTVKYVFNLSSFAGYPLVPTAPSDVSQIICTFDTATPQNVSCWLVVNGTTVDYVSGNATATAGLDSGPNGAMLIYTGLRADPFFFNLDGFNATIADVAAAAPTLVFDAAGCPAVDPATSAALVTQLASGADGGMPYDHFALQNVLTITIQVRASAVTSAGNQVLSIWAATTN